MNIKKYRNDGQAPLYQQARDYVISLIENDKIKEHESLPSERILGDLFKISRMTARQALLAVESEGLAYSNGRKGRFVSPKKMHYDLSSTVSFSRQAQKEHIDLSIELISASTIKANDDLAAKLSCKMGTKLNTYKRLFSIGGRPAFVEDEYVIASSFPDLLEQDLCQSSTQLLETRYNAIAYKGGVVIRLYMLPEDTAKLLGLSMAQAGIELEQIVFDDKGVPFCFGRQLWRGDVAEFSGQIVIER